MNRTTGAFHTNAWACAAAALIWVAAASATARAQSENEAVLLLDHSGSMWAQIEGAPKVSIMRDAVDAMLREHSGRLDLGVIAYGAQKTKNCESIDTLKPVGAIDADADAKAIASVRPNGTAAIAASLAAADKLFETEAGGRSIILISDSTDDCKADPCAAAETLKTQSPNTVAHVIAFSEQDLEPLQALSCVAEKTGGTFQTAASAGELNEAVRKAFELASLGLPGDVLAQPFGELAGEDGQAAGPGSAFLSDDPGTLVLSAVLAQSAAPLTSGLIWRVYGIEVEEDGSYKLLHRFEDSQIAVTLPPGEYLVNASYGQAHVTKRVTVWPGRRVEDTLNLQAGGLRLYATLANEPLIAENALRFDVFSEETDQFGNKRRVIAGAKSGVVLRLNSGTYRVLSRYGDANSVMEVDVAVEPGKLTEATIDHQAGKVTFRLVERQGGEALADTIWHIYSGNGELVRKSGGAFPTHVLAAGDYSVRVEHGGREFVAKFAVGVGDKQQVEVIKP